MGSKATWQKFPYVSFDARFDTIMVKIEKYSTIGYSLVPKWIKSVPKFKINLEEYEHMFLRTQNGYPKWGQCLMYFVEDPFTLRKATNENNMLRLGDEIVNSKH